MAREWELDKARILSAVAGGGGADMAELSLAREVSQVSRVHDSTLAGASALSQPELLYARGGLRPATQAVLRHDCPDKQQHAGGEGNAGANPAAAAFRPRVTMASEVWSFIFRSNPHSEVLS